MGTRVRSAKVQPRLGLAMLRPPTTAERILAAIGFVGLAAGALAYGLSEKNTGSSRASGSRRGAKPAGPHVTTPTDLTGRRWKHIAARTWSEFNKDQIPQVAGGVAFFALLAIFPAMAAFVSLYGLFADSATVGEHLRILGGILPRSALSFVSEEMTRLAGGKHPALGLAFVVSLLLSLWSANGAVKAIFSGLNTAYETTEKRGLIWLNVISLAFTVGALLFVMVTLGLVVAAPILMRGLGWSGGLNPVVVDVARWPLLFVFSTLTLAVLYRYGPDRKKARWRWITPGSAIATALWLVASMLFSWYVANFAHYEKTYGSLGAVVGFMTWLWLSTIVILAGAELNQEVEAEAVGEPKRLPDAH